MPAVINVPADFSTIQAAINAAASYDTVQVAAGLYQENINITKPLTLLGANAGVSGGGVRGPETQIRTVGNQTAVVAISSAAVTVDGVFINGNDPGVTGVTLASGSDANADYGVRPTTNYLNLNIKNNIVQDVKIGFRGDGLSTGSVIESNWFNSVGSYDFGYAVSLRTGFYADVKNNKMTEVWTGIHTNNFNGAGGPATWTMSGNEIHSYAAGFCYWLQFGSATPVTFNNNSITAETGAVTNNFGILLVSVQNALNPTFTNVTITGTDYGIGMTNTSTSNTVTFGATTQIIGTKKAGVYLTDNLTFNPVGTTSFLTDAYTDPIAVNLTGVSITGALGKGVFVETSRGTNDVATTANISGATISGTSGTIGVDVAGPTAIANLTCVTISGFDTGIKNTGGSLAINNGNSITGGTTGLAISGSGADLNCNTLNNLLFTGQTGQYIDLTNCALDGLTIDATCVKFDGVKGANAGLAGNFDIEDKVHHAVDNGNLGFVRVNAGQVYVTPTSGNIQLGVDAAECGDTVNVEAGTYIADENIVDCNDGVVFGLMIDKSITLLGPNPDYDPSCGLAPANPQAIILPGASDPNPFSSTAFIIMGVSASNVTIKGFTIDGSNPELAEDCNTFMHNGVPISASEGIASYANISGITVKGNVVKNTGYTGINFNNATYGQSEIDASIGNCISKNYLSNLGGGGYGYGIGVLVSNSFYANISRNIMDVVYVGVQANNFALANPGCQDDAVIEKNDIQAVHRGIFYNLFYAAASPFLVKYNDITAIEDSSSVDDWSGILIASQQNSVSATFRGNDIDGSGALDECRTVSGIESWNTTTCGLLLVDGGTIKNVNNGVWVNTYESYNQSADGSQITLRGVDISAEDIGVYVEDSPANTDCPPAEAFAVIECGTTITTDCGVGVKVSGEYASVEITDSYITNNDIGLLMEGGVACVDYSFITGNNVGVEVADDCATPNVTLFANDLSCNDTYISNTSCGVVQASANWFGTTNVSSITADICGAVDYSPILNFGDSSNCDEGFQPDFSSLTVHADGSQLCVTSRIQEAIDLLADGSLCGSSRLVVVLGGTYEGDVCFDKAGTLSPGGACSTTIVTICGDLSFTNCNTILAVDINSPYATAGANYDQIIVKGDFDFSGGSLATKGGGAFAAISAPITLVKVPYGCTTAGTNPAQGAGLTLGANQFIVSYTAGSHSTDFALLATPVISSPTITNLGTLTVTLGATVTSAGSSPIIKRGVLYSTTNSNPTLGGLNVIQVDDPSATTGSFTRQINGLTAGTHYYAVAYARNAEGTVYTSPVSQFTTKTTPETSIVGPTAGQRNTPLTYTLLTYDPTPGMQNYLFVFKIKWGDGKTDTVTAKSGTTFNHTYTSVGTYVITMTATNGRGMTLAAGSLTVVISNVAPPPGLAFSGSGDSSKVSSFSVTTTAPTSEKSSVSSTTPPATGNPSLPVLGFALSQSTGTTSAVNGLAQVLASGSSGKTSSVVDSLFGNDDLKSILG